MKIATISDVHIKESGDEAEALLLKFLKHPLVQQCDYVALLGDIFDLMCGPHSIYLQQFQAVFDAIDDLQKSGVKIIYIEGNHDVHLKKLFRKKWKKDEVILSQSHIVLSEDNCLYYLSHGDDHEVDNESYQKYKKIIFSAPLRFVANYLLPYRVLEFVGRKASQKSRKRGSQIFNEDLVRERFRKGVEVNNPEADIIIGGHSHVKDSYTLKSGSVYLNNGYALREKVFIYVDNKDYQFVSL
ncbi:MAG TPA: UDP-2,3-diacylglucosamine diphosphatase [Bacteriovoracaceae bacterium]|nr:UDP-2,3-diacylglucosamine diphosphatase [Bacteriovoracaceae bacterium]